MLVGGGRLSVAHRRRDKTAGRCQHGTVFGCHADVAQLVEHHLAKVRVAGSNPVVRSKQTAGQAPFPRVPDCFHGGEHDIEENPWSALRSSSN